MEHGNNMATWFSRYELVYLNPDGSWSRCLAAHWDAEPFLLDLQTGILVEMERR
jgi:hypothetical protein